jgi:hypothetical protein
VFSKKKDTRIACPFSQFANSCRLVTARRLFHRGGSVSGRRLGHRFLMRRRSRGGLGRVRRAGAQERHGKKRKHRRKNDKFFHR